VELRGVSGRGVPAANQLRVPLRIEAVWWRQPWAWLLAAGLVGSALYGLHRRRLARVRQVERLRSRIAADLHDEVGTLLTRVSLQAELLRQQPAEAGPVLERLLSNSRQAAGTMRDIVWGIDAQADTVGALLDRMRDHLDQTASPAGLATELHVRGLRDAQPLPPELRQHLYLIFKEAVSNAARHARGATRLDVTLARESGWLTLLVQDDGQPTGAATRSGMGRRNMQQRAGLLGGTLLAEARPQGFVVQLRVPF
jgi:signal transduction histidine kinase